MFQPEGEAISELTYVSLRESSIRIERIDGELFYLPIDELNTLVEWYERVSDQTRGDS